MFHARLDAFASVLVHRHVMERADPVATTSRPQADVLHIGGPIRLYTATNSRLVAEGFITPLYNGEARGSTEPTHRGSANEQGAATLEGIHVPGALAVHHASDEGAVQTLRDLGVGTKVMWNLVSVVFWFAS